VSKYTPEFKARVLETYVKDGPAVAAREFEMPLRTVKYWAHQQGVCTEAASKETTVAANEALRLRRAGLREKMLQRADQMLERMGEKYRTVAKDGTVVEYDAPPASVCKDLALTLAILVDKLRLEEGEATERTETLTIDVLDREIARLEAEVAASRDGG
jgi:transposase-like protein